MKIRIIGLILCLATIGFTSCSQGVSEPTEETVDEGTIPSSSLPTTHSPSTGTEVKAATEEPTWTPEPTKTAKPFSRLNPEDIQGEILCSVYPDGELAIINADGSQISILLEASYDMDINCNRHPRWLPDGSGFSYTVDDFSHAEIWVTDSLEDPGQLFLGDVATYSSHAWSPDGRSIAFVSTSNQIVIYNLDTQTTINLTDDHVRSAADPVWSPDGTRIAFSGLEQGNQDIYLIDVDGTNLIRVTTHEGTDQYPSWSPDGSKIVFSSTRDGDRIKDIFVIDLSLDTEEEGNLASQLTFDDTLDITPDWSPDGQYIVYAAHTFGAEHATIFIIDEKGTSRFQLTKENTYHFPQWRP